MRFNKIKVIKLKMVLSMHDSADPPEVQVDNKLSQIHN